MPKELLVKFILVPPCRLRQVMFERGNREGMTFWMVFDLLRFYSLPYGPYCNTFLNDMKILMMGMRDHEVQRVVERLKRGKDAFARGPGTAMMGLITACMVQLDRNLGDDITKNIIYFNCANMNGKGAVNEIGGEVSARSRCQEARSSSLRVFAHPRTLAIVWPTLPSEVAEKIVSLSDPRMRLVNKAASSFSHRIPGSPSHPLMFFRVLCGDMSNWFKLACAHTGAFEQVSKHDAAMIHRFFKDYSHECFELEQYYAQMCANTSLAYERAIRHKLMKLGAEPVPDTVQSCLLASLVFERGIFGTVRDSTVKDILFSIARLYFPDKVRDLEAARDDHLKGDICALFKDSRVPWYWTLVFYGDLSACNEILSIRRILKDDESCQMLNEFAVSVDLKDHYLLRSIYQRLDEMQSSVMGFDETGEFAKLLFIRFCKHIGVDPKTGSKSAAILSVPELLELYFDGCFMDIPQKINCPKAAGPLHAKLLLRLLRAIYNDHDNDAMVDVEGEKGSRFDKNECLKRFGIVLPLIDLTFIPIKEIVEYLDSRDEGQLFTEIGNEPIRYLICALNFSSYMALPNFAIKFFQFHKLQKLYDKFLRMSCRKGASIHMVSRFTSQIFLMSTVSFSDVILSRRIQPQNYIEEDVLIRCVSLVPNLGLIVVPALLLIPGDATVLELYCRVAKLTKATFGLKFADKTILMPTNVPVRALENKLIIIDCIDQKGASSVLHFLGFF